MYKIKRNGRVLKNKTFYTYDDARKWVRRFLTKQWHKGVITKNFGDAVNRTFTIGEYGYSISAVK